MGHPRGRHRGRRSSSSSQHDSPPQRGNSAQAEEGLSQPQMYGVSSTYLSLIRQVGADGTRTQHGELFTIKQLCFYLKEYIKYKSLYNPQDPRQVLCANDPLGKVFGVSTFTIFQAVSLVQQQTYPIPSQKSPATSLPAQTLGPATLCSSASTTDTVLSSVPLSTGCVVPKLCAQDSAAAVLPFAQYSVPDSTVDLPMEASNCNAVSGTRTPSPTPNIIHTEMSTTLLMTEATSHKSPSNRVETVTKCATDDEEDDYYFHSQRATAENLQASSTENDLDVTFELPDDTAAVQSEHKTPVKQIRALADMQIPAQHARQALMFKDRDENDNVEGEELRGAGLIEAGLREADSSHEVDPADDEGVYDCEPSTSQQPESRAKQVRSPAFPPPPRRRQSSVSITCAQDAPWCLRLEIQDHDDDTDTDREEILSIQSKETMLVKDSSDDLWFLDDEEEDDDDNDDDDDDNAQDRDTHSRLGGISVTFQDAESPFEEEYELASGSDVNMNEEDVHGRSEQEESAEEEIIVSVRPRSRAACDWDIEFWADSESSQEESDDEDITDKDKWLCDGCDTLNSPLHRYCDRCWQLRPDWLPGSQPGSRAASPEHTSRRRTPSKERRKRRKQPVQRISTMPFAMVNTDDDMLPSSQGSYLGSSQEIEARLQGQDPSQRSQGQEQSQRAQRQRSRSRSMDSSEGEEEPTLTHSYLSTEELTRMRLGDAPLQRQASSEEVLNKYLSNRQIKNSSSEKPSTSQESPSNNPVPKCTETELQSRTYSIAQETLSKNISPSTSSQKDINIEDDTKDLSNSQDFSLILCSSSQEASSQGILSSSQEGITGSSQEVTLGSSQIGSSSQGTASSQELRAESLGAASSQDATARLRRSDTNDTLPSSDINLRRLDDFLNDQHYRNSQIGVESHSKERPLKRPAVEESDVSGKKAKLSPTKRTRKDSGSMSTLCQLCYNGPKDAVLVHGKSGHQMSCYACAKKLRRYGKPCPICRRPVQRVIRNFMV